MGYTTAMGALALHRLLLRFALASAGLFVWVFLFHYFAFLTVDISRALAQTALLYALTSVVVCLATPYAARMLRNGTHRSLAFGLIFAACAFVLAGAALEGFWSAETVGVAVSLFAITLGLYRALYWVPYATESAAEGKGGSMTSEFLVSLAPALAGILIAAFFGAPVWLLYAGAVLVVLSALPLIFVDDVHENFSWEYRRTFQELLVPEHRAYVTHAFLEGMAGAALLLFWPLAVFLLLGWSYGMLGIVLSATFLVAIFVRYPVRSLLRRARLADSRLLTAVFAATPWLFRLTVASPLGVVLVDSYFYTTTPRRLGVDPFAFEQRSDGGSLIDEFTALKEIALHAGKAVACILGAAVALIVSVPAAFLAVFIIAALTSVSLALSGR